MPIPDLTAQQFAVLDALGGAERSGRELRAALAERGIRKSGPAFYVFMARMEKLKFVRGRYETKVIDGQTIRVRRYRLSGQGATALNNTRMFYAPTGNAGVPGVIA